MAMTTKERTDLREELTGQGYSWNYIDEWPSKTTLYRHREIKNPGGEVVSSAGTALPNLPGHPDYVNRKARQGLLPWPPGESCNCMWCVERNGTLKPEPSGKERKEAPAAPKARGNRRVGPYFKAS